MVQLVDAKHNIFRTLSFMKLLWKLNKWSHGKNKDPLIKNEPSLKYRKKCDLREASLWVRGRQSTEIIITPANHLIFSLLLAPKESERINRLKYLAPLEDASKNPPLRDAPDIFCPPLDQKNEKCPKYPHKHKKVYFGTVHYLWEGGAKIF